MNRLSGLQSLALTGALCGSIGCSLQYNGAFGPPEQPSDKYIHRRIALQNKSAAANTPTPSDHTTDPKTQDISSTKGHDSHIVEFYSTKKLKRAKPAPLATKPLAVRPVQRPTIKRTASAAIKKVSPRPRQAVPQAPTAVRIRPIGLFGQLPNIDRSRVGMTESADNVRRITFATEGADFDPQIDPAGKMLVYASTQHRETSDLYIKRINGNTITQLTNDPANDVMPTPSPDGQRIAFASDRAGNWDIYMIDISGGQPVQLTNGPADDLHPSFSRDGKQLVYSSYSQQAGQWELVVIDVENPAAKRFIGFGLFPEWSPSDNRILFQRARERGTRWFSIWTVDFVNGEGVRPTEIAASTNAACITPTWSPDGRHISFSTVVNPNEQDNINPSQADVWIMRDDGGARVNLTNSSDVNLQPAWAADGAIYFVSNRAGKTLENIWSVRPDRSLQIVGYNKPSDTRSTLVDTP